MKIIILIYIGYARHEDQELESLKCSLNIGKDNYDFEHSLSLTDVRLYPRLVKDMVADNKKLAESLNAEFQISKHAQVIIDKSINS